MFFMPLCFALAGLLFFFAHFTPENNGNLPLSLIFFLIGLILYLFLRASKRNIEEVSAA